MQIYKYMDNSNYKVIIFKGKNYEKRNTNQINRG